MISQQFKKLYVFPKYYSTCFRMYIWQYQSYFRP